MIPGAKALKSFERCFFGDKFDELATPHVMTTSSRASPIWAHVNNINKISILCDLVLQL